MKLRVFAALLSLCLLLTACAAVPGQPQGTQVTNLTDREQEKQPDTTEPPEQSQEEFVPAVYGELPVEDSYYHYGNMQKSAAGECFVRYGDQVLFRGTVNMDNGYQRSRLYAYDLETGEVRYFCNIPNCNHDTSACRLLSLPRVNLEYYGGKLYSHSYFSDPVVLEGSQWEYLDIRANRSWHAYGDLFTIAGYKLQFYEDGQGEPRTIMTDYNYMMNVVFGRYLYSHSCVGLVRVDLLADNPVKETVMEEVFCMVEGEYIYYVDDAEKTDTYYLYRCDMDGSNSELLLDQPILPASLNFDDEYLYFRLYTEKKIDRTEDGKDIYRMSKADPAQVEKIATLPETAYMIFTVPEEDVVFVTTYRGNNIYAMKRDGSELKKLELG